VCAFCVLATPAVAHPCRYACRLLRQGEPVDTVVRTRCVTSLIRGCARILFGAGLGLVPAVRAAANRAVGLNTRKESGQQPSAISWQSVCGGGGGAIQADVRPVPSHSLVLEPSLFFYFYLGVAYSGCLGLGIHPSALISFPLVLRLCGEEGAASPVLVCRACTSVDTGFLSYDRVRRGWSMTREHRLVIMGCVPGLRLGFSLYAASLFCPPSSADGCSCQLCNFCFLGFFSTRFCVLIHYIHNNEGHFKKNFKWVRCYGK